MDKDDIALWTIAKHDLDVANMLMDISEGDSAQAYNIAKKCFALIDSAISKES